MFKDETITVRATTGHGRADMAFIAHIGGMHGHYGPTAEEAEQKLRDYLARRQEQREQSENEQRTFSPSWGEIGTVGLLVLFWLTLGALSYAGAAR